MQVTRYLQEIFLKITNMTRLNILLTGGLGFIGSHTASVLLSAGHEVVILDNLSNSKLDVIERIESITDSRVIFFEGDVNDTSLVERILAAHKINAVIHFAGSKSVGESNEKPVEYYENNVSGTISLLKAMSRFEVRKLIFSSSATVYGIPNYLPIDEKHQTTAINPYGRTKLHIEEILSDVATSNQDWRIICLRYFNPVGAHESGLIGEDPNQVPNNLFPYISKVAAGEFPYLDIYGDDYNTDDGTGVRDYIHVLDVADGHLAALKHIGNSNRGFDLINLGSGHGSSVFEIIKTFERVNNVTIDFKIVARRKGDVASCYADTSKASRLLNWSAARNLEEMCSSAWKFVIRDK